MLVLEWTFTVTTRPRFQTTPAWDPAAQATRAGAVTQYFVGEAYSTQPLNITRDKLFVNYHAADASAITYQLVFGAGAASGASGAAPLGLTANLQEGHSPPFVCVCFCAPTPDAAPAHS